MTTIAITLTTLVSGLMALAATSSRKTRLFGADDYIMTDALQEHLTRSAR